MAKDKRYYSFNEEDLKFENEFRKLKLRAELGVALGQEPYMSPEREREWLSSVEAEEKAWADLPRVTVFQYLGEPKGIKSLARLSRQEIDTELNYVQRLLNTHNVEVLSVSALKDKDLYRFITEEVFFEEIPANREKGVKIRFVYEDFHPNPELELKENIKGFFQKVFARSWKLVEGQFAAKVQSVKPTAVGRSVILNRLQCWVEPYEEIFLAQIEFLKIEVNGDEAVLAVSIHYEGAWAANGALVSGDILANFQLKNQNGGYWSISGIFMSCLP